ncbi:uncharacterized protein [Palaemon carinicauda]|uniref:uncharacterized protein n=1 Tax=Palaemon carinicauda TaxID=392227 RepID=UPI0035B68CEA
MASRRGRVGMAVEGVITVIVVLMMGIPTLESAGMGGGALPNILMGTDPACGGMPYGECQIRLQKCAEVKGLTQGTAGPVKDVFDCATLQGIPKTQVISVLPAAFQSGQPDTIMDRIVINDTAAATRFRRCVLTAAGVITMNGTLDRTALISKLHMKTTVHPLLMDVVSKGINDCPEPPNMKVGQFMTCVRKHCVQNMPESIVALPPYGAYSGASDDDHHSKKCKKGKKGKGCKKH